MALLNNCSQDQTKKERNVGHDGSDPAMFQNCLTHFTTFFVFFISWNYFGRNISLFVYIYLQIKLRIEASQKTRIYFHTQPINSNRNILTQHNQLFSFTYYTTITTTQLDFSWAFGGGEICEDVLWVNGCWVKFINMTSPLEMLYKNVHQ